MRTWNHWVFFQFSHVSPKMAVSHKRIWQNLAIKQIENRKYRNPITCWWTTRTYYLSMMVSKEESFLGDFITFFLKIWELFLKNFQKVSLTMLLDFFIAKWWSFLTKRITAWNRWEISDCKFKILEWVFSFNKICSFFDQKTRKLLIFFSYCKIDQFCSFSNTVQRFVNFSIIEILEKKCLW